MITVIQRSSITALIQRNWWLNINNIWKIIISGTSEIRFNMFPINWGKKNYPFSSRIYHQILTLLIDAYPIDSYFSVWHWNNTLALDSYPTSFHLVGCSGMFYAITADREFMCMITPWANNMTIEWLLFQTTRRNIDYFLD